MSNRNWQRDKKFEFYGESFMPRFKTVTKKGKVRYFALFPGDVVTLRDTLTNWLKWWEEEKDKPVVTLVTAESTPFTDATKLTDIEMVVKRTDPVKCARCNDTGWIDPWYEAYADGSTCEPCEVCNASKGLKPW